MVFRDGQPYEPNLAPPALHPAQRVWVCRFTGALFPTYEEYLKKLSTYRQRVWSCKFTGCDKLSYEEALTSEAKCQGLLDQFPDCFEEPVTRLVHYATLKQDDLCQRIAAYFKDRFVPGEEVTGIRDSAEAACRVVAAVERGDAEPSLLMSNAVPLLPADPEDEYQVEWIADSQSAVLKRSDMVRTTMPLTRTVIKSWLPFAAEAETVQKVKGIPCIWRVKDQLCSKFGLSTETPVALKERMERAQQRREEQSRRTSKAEQESEEYVYLSDADAEEEEEDEGIMERAAELKAKITALGGASPSAGVLTELLRTEGKLEIPVESLEESRERLQPGTVKRVLFDALEAAGDKSMTIAALVEAVQASGLKTWDGARSANSSVAATCTHDRAFLRTGPGQFALRAFRQETMQISTTVLSGRQNSDDLGPAPAVERNTFKCAKCHKTQHPENSPLVLCDGCPRSFHLVCLDLTFEDLPQDDWHCSKCQERKSSTGRRLTSYDRKSDIYERMHYSDAEKDERLVLRMMSRAERDKRKADERTDKERQRDENRFLREKAREAARWAALHPQDDLEMLDDEEEALAAADMQSQVAAEEAARAVRRAQAKGDGSMDERVARLQQRAKAASERAAALRLVIEGPQPPEPGVRTEAARTALYDALAIMDFVTIFGASFEAAPLTLLELQQAAAFPLDTDHLAHLYIALLRCLLIEAMAMEGVVRSRAKRWGRVIDEATWPEILRRYLLASRAGLPVPEELGDDSAEPDSAHMDDNTACIVGAKLLTDRPYYKLGAGLHLRILASLCSDVSDCTNLRAEISARVEEMIQLQSEFRQKQNEDRKRQKEEAMQRVADGHTTTPEQTPGLEVGSQEGKVAPAAEPKPDAEEEDAETETDDERPIAVKPAEEPAAAATPSGQPDAGAKPRDEQQEDLSDPPMPNFDLPEDLKEYKGSKRDRKELQEWKARRSEAQERLAKEKGAWERQQKERRRKRQKLQQAKKQAEQAVVAAQEEDHEEEMREREAALDDAMDARAIRGEALGMDRHYRRYWWLPGEPAVIFVEEADGSALGALEAPEDLESLTERLNQNGLREKVLLQNLVKRKDTILSTLGYHSVNLDLGQAPRLRPEQDSQAEAGEASKAAIEASAQKMCEFLDQLDSIPAAPATSSVADWKARLQAVTTNEQLVTAVLELEGDINSLGSGLPSGADNASLAGFGKHRKSAAAGDSNPSTEQPSSAEPEPAPDEQQLPNGTAKPEAAAHDIAVKAEARDAQPGVQLEAELRSEHAAAGQSGRQASPMEGIAMANGMSASAGQPAARDMLANGSALQPSYPTDDAAALEPSLLSNGRSLLPKPAAMDEAHQQQQLRRQGTGGESGDQPPADGALVGSAAAMDVDEHVKQEEDDRKILAANGPHPQETAGEVEGETAVDRHATAMSACATVEHLFKDDDYRLPADYIDPPDELDASDSEGSKNRRGGTLWRSSRERKVWLKDTRRALHAEDTSCAAYVAAVLIDRAQPLLRSLQRATKRAEKEAAEIEALEAAAAAANAGSSGEGTPQATSRAEKAAKGFAKSGSKPAPAADMDKPAKAEGSQPRLKKSKRSGELPSRASGRSSEGPPPTKKARTSIKLAAAAVSTVPSTDGEQPADADDDAPPQRSDRWNTTCQTCGEEGDLLCCEAPDCAVAQHVACAGLDDMPKSEWYCAQHTHKPSLKRKRSRTVRSSAEPHSGPTTKSTGDGKAIRHPSTKLAVAEGSDSLSAEGTAAGKRGPAAAKKRKR